MQAHDEHITTAPRDAGAMDHSAMGRGPTGAGLPVTRAQLTVVSLTTVLALVAALIFSVGYTNLTLSAHDVGGAVMPPGMIMPRDMPGEAMREMSAVDPRTISYRAPANSRGDQELPARLENGVKVYDLEVSVIQWNILPNTPVAAYALNRQVPGPRIRITEGDRVRFNV